MSNRPKRQSGDPRKSSTATKEQPMSTIHQTMSDIANDDTVVINPVEEAPKTWWDHVVAFFNPVPKTPEQERAEMQARLDQFDAHQQYLKDLAVAKDAVKSGRHEYRQSRREVAKAKRELATARRRRLRYELACIFRRSANRLNVEEATARRDILNVLIRKAEENLLNAQALHETNRRNLTNAKVEYRVAKKGSPKWLARHGAEALEIHREKIESRIWARIRFVRNLRKFGKAVTSLANTMLATLSWVVVGFAAVTLAFGVALVVAVKLLLTALVVTLVSMISMLTGGIRSALLA